MSALEYLTSFRESAGRVRGEGAHEQIETLITRWQKVVRDCEGDGSEYRRQYAATHQQFIEELSYIKNRDSGMFALYESSLNGAKQVFANAWKKTSEGDISLVGVLDASAHIVVELEKVLNV